MSKLLFPQVHRDELQKIAIIRVLRRRKLVIRVSILSTVHRRMTRRAPCQYIPRLPFSFEVDITGLTDSLFTRLHHMSKDCFFVLARLVAVQRAQSGRAFLKSSPLLRLSLTLRWLAGGSYLDVSLAHHVSPNSFYFYVDETIRDIENALSIEFPYDDEWLANSSRGCTRNGRSPLVGFVGALDGITVRIQEPTTKEVGNTSTYYNRKGFFAINVQAMCDSKYRFLFVSGRAAGFIHDSTAYGMSGLCKVLSDRSKGLCLGYWVACDDAYCATHNMLTPWPVKRLAVHKDCFNYWLSSARIFIEQAFGILVARWGIFWRPLRVKVAKAARIVVTCCKIHNFIIENKGSVDVPNPSGWDSGNHTEDANHIIELQDECDTDYSLHCRRRDLESCNSRDHFTECIKAEGLKRPLVY